MSAPEPAQQETPKTAPTGWSGKKIALLIFFIVLIIAMLGGVWYAYSKPSANAAPAPRLGNAGVGVNLNRGSTLSP